MNDPAPITRWKHDVLKADGEAKFREIVAQVLIMCDDASGTAGYGCTIV